jgi:D-3-phosphoglycerate dehydrogenase / 2-oxoglutarate reductase
MHGTGVDHIDVAAASAKGIYVGNAPGSNNNAVAELTVGLIIGAARYIPQAHSSVLQQGWLRRVGSEVAGKTVGIVGLGCIGKRVIELLGGFGVDCLAHDPYPDIEFASRWRVRYVGLDELLAQADVVSLHLPLLPATAGLIGARQLGLMKPTAIIVNTARGALIDEQALYQALRDGQIAGAALDAFAGEPLAADSPLRSLNNIILTPHIAASSAEAAAEVDLVNARTVSGVLTGRELYSVVNAAAVAAVAGQQPK